MIAVKEEKLRSELLGVNPKLLLIIADAHEYMHRVHNYNIITITSVLRLDNPNSVHAHGRGVDIRSIDMTQHQIDSLVEYINNKYVYDVSRPNLKTLFYHKVVGGQWHLHFQVR